MDPDGLSRQERVEQLRRRIAAVPAKGELAQRNRGVVPVPAPLAELLPDGGLPRGSVTAYSGASSLLLGVLAAVTADGGHAAVLGKPQLGLLAAAEMGADLRRIALVPRPGPDPVEVAAVLLDGLDLVVCGLGGASVSPSRARAVVARARSKGAALIVTDGRWEATKLDIDARVVGYAGLQAGRGRLRGVELEVRTRARAATRVGRFELRSARAAVEWVGAQRHLAVAQ